jgi:acetate kinase
MNDVVLTINAGSSSIKFAIYGVVEGEPELEVQGQLEGRGSHPHLVAQTEDGRVIVDRGERELEGDGAKSLAELIRDALAQRHVIAAGHRVAHGGPDFAGPVLVDDDSLRKLSALIPLAPLHQPFNLAPIEGLRREFPHLPQVACFDTAFHRGHPEVADYFALPRELHAEGVRRYGFHGLSYDYITRTLPSAAPEIAGKRVVIAHLGSGASMCATLDGKSVDCTLSFTGLGGLPMGTRCGDLDPGVMFHLLQQKKLSVDQLESLLYKESGLKGLSGISNDLRDLETSREPAAQLAIDVFVYRIAYALGGLAAVLGGLDGIVFTAGIGEHSKRIRAEVLRRSAWLGVVLDERRNESGGPLISADGSPVRAYAIPTDEQITIARQTLAVAGVAFPAH